MTCEQQDMLLRLAEQLQARGFDVRVGWIDCDAHGKHAAHFRHSRCAASRSFPQTPDESVGRNPEVAKVQVHARGNGSGAVETPPRERIEVVKAEFDKICERANAAGFDVGATLRDAISEYGQADPQRTGRDRSNGRTTIRRENRQPARSRKWHLVHG
jgi:hypothetical protein